MARIRSIKPGFFKDSELYDAEKASGLPLRLAYAGLWTVADREGRFRWLPREIKTDVLPYDDVSMEEVLNALSKYGFVFKYKCNGYDYGYIPKFSEHQHVNKNEAPSTLPEPPKTANSRAKKVVAPSKNINSRASTASVPDLHHEELTSGVMGREQEGKGTETSAEPQAAPAPEASPAISIPTNMDGVEHCVSQAQVDEFSELYPAVNVLQELRQMRAWSLSNRRQRKTSDGMPRFINAWLAKQQNKSGMAYGAKPMNGESKSWEKVPESGKRKGVEAALAELAASKKLQ